VGFRAIAKSPEGTTLEYLKSGGNGKYGITELPPDMTLIPDFAQANQIRGV